MKNWILFFCLVTGLIGWNIACGPKSSTPTTPANNNPPAATNTFTATASPTATGVNTVTSTPTKTSTVTSTITVTPTITGTITSTATSTTTGTQTDSPTPTTTPTPTETPTVTNSPTITDSPTNSPTVSYATYQATYTFPSDTQGFAAIGQIGGNQVTIPTGWTNSLSPAPPAGGNAITVAAPFNLATTWTSQPPDNVIVGVAFSTPINLNAGSVITFAYECPGNTTSTSAQIVLYAATGSASGGSLPGGWVNTLSTTWSQCGITISSAATGVTEIGMQLLYGGGASNYAHVGPVTVNIASVSITDGPSVLPTATYTPTMIPNYSITFEDGSVDSFWENSPATSTGCVISAQSYSTLGITGLTTLTNPNNYGMDMTNTSAGGTWQQAAMNYINIGGGTNGFPMDFTSLGAVGVRCEMYAMPNVTSWAGGDIDIVTSGSTYGIGGASNLVPGGYSFTNLTVGSWVEVAYEPTGGNWSTDKTNVTGLIVEDTFGGGQAATSDVIVDDIEFY